jgi:hypothetical protein
MRVVNVRMLMASALFIFILIFLCTDFFFTGEDSVQAGGYDQEEETGEREKKVIDLSEDTF